MKNPLSKDETCRDGSIHLLSLHHYLFCKTMSQVLCPNLPLTKFDLRFPRQWFKHTQFLSFLTMTLVLAFLKVLYGVHTSTDITNFKTLITLTVGCFLRVEKMTATYPQMKTRRGMSWRITGSQHTQLYTSVLFEQDLPMMVPSRLRVKQTVGFYKILIFVLILW